MRLKYDLEPLLNIFWPARVTQKENCTISAIFIFHQPRAFKEPLDTTKALSPSCVMPHCQSIFIPRPLLLAWSEMQQVFAAIRPSQPGWGDKDVCNSTGHFPALQYCGQDHVTYLWWKQLAHANCNMDNIRAIVLHPVWHAPHVTRVIWQWSPPPP